MTAFATKAIMKKHQASNPDKKVSCKTCHTKGKELNDFGKKMKK